MSRIQSTSIGGVVLRVSARDPSTRILPPAIPAYNSFITPHPGPVGDITIEVQTGPVASYLQDCGPPLFDSDSVWSISFCGDGYLLNHHPFEEGPHLWSIRSNPDFSTLTAQCDAALVTGTKNRPAVPTPIVYPLDQVILMHYLAKRRGLVVHCAGLGIGNRICIFPGRSGAGKSTVADLLRGHDDIGLLSDDRILLRGENDGIVAYGTPWPGDAGIAVNRSAPLAGIYFLNQAGKNRLVELRRSEALNRLLPVASIPWYDRGVLGDVLDFCGEVVTSVPVFELQFARDGRLGEFLTGECMIGKQVGG